MKKEYIFSLGIIGIIYNSVAFFSLLKLFSRKEAIVFTDKYLIDHSRYESLGEIEWKEITKIERLKKYSIEVTLRKNYLSHRKIKLIKKFLLYMHNWNYNKSIIISSALLDCGTNDLFNLMTEAYENSKLE